MASLCKNLRLARLCPKFFSNITPLNPVNSQFTARSTAPLALRASHTMAPTTLPPADSSAGDIMETRKASPAHYLVKMDSFSLFDKLRIDKYETKRFQAGGYEWILKIYLNGHRNEYGYGNDGDSISVNLALADTSALPPNWKVNVVSSFCLFNHNTGSYNYALDRMRFNAMNTESRFPRFITKKHLMDPSNGYLNGDKCVFGAEVFVNENKAVTEYVFLKNVKFPPFKRVFKIPNFPLLEDGWYLNKTWTSEAFTAGGCRWKISVYRKGHYRENNCLFTFLQRVDSENTRVGPTYTLSLKSHVPDGRHVKYTTGRWYSYSPTQGATWSGWPSHIDLASLNDPSKGYIVNGCVDLEIDLSVEALPDKY